MVELGYTELPRPTQIVEIIRPGFVGKFRESKYWAFVLHYPPDTVELTVMDQN